VTSRLRLVAAAALTLAVLPLGATASAETWTHTDARRDAVRVVMDLSSGEEERSAAPDDRAADVTRVVVAHRNRAVTIRVGVRDLPRRGSSSLLARLRTPGNEFMALTSRGPGLLSFMLISRRSPEGVSCTGGQVDFDAVADVTTVRIPRSCLGSPAWVRAGALMTSGDTDFFGGMTGDEMPEALTSTYDDALRDGGRAAGLPALSPKVRLG
jgi:hypothetical protein